MSIETMITAVRGRRIWDSRGRPTVEVDVRLANGTMGRGVAPAGASRGTREAIDLRDGDPALGGFGVARALANIETVIGPLLMGRNAIDQEAIDRALIDADGTAQKSKLGGNATIAASLAVLDAAAAAHHLPLWKYVAGDDPVRLPLPQIQIFGGGAHAGRRIDIQDLMVIPLSADTFAEGLEMVAETYLAAGRMMNERGVASGVADEGGHWPAFDSNEHALSSLVEAIERAGFAPGHDVGIALDIAASEFGRDGRYRLALEDRELDRSGMVALIASWLERYPIVSIEDPLAEDDPEGWAMLMQQLAHNGKRVQVVGDDLLVTNAALVDNAADRHLCNAVLIKPNQAGTVTETREAIAAARRHRMRTIVSARSGETEDVAIAHLAVGWNAGQLKVGSFARSERMAKWNEVLRIEESLVGNGSFPAGDELADPA
jgi:enolase